MIALYQQSRKQGVLFQQTKGDCTKWHELGLGETEWRLIQSKQHHAKSFLKVNLDAFIT